MSQIIEKHRMILEHEKKFAYILAKEVIKRPKLSLWMILIPIIFVYYFFQLQKCTEGRKKFVENYLISRKRASNEALQVVTTGNPPDINKLVQMATTIPTVARQAYAEWMSVLVEHYTELLCSDGKDFDSIVKSAYKNRANFLFFLNHLNRLEKQLNAALKSHISESSELIDRVVKKIEDCSEKLRRKNAEKIFT